ncbi:MAG: hypothetical protein R3F39_10755 [Myxococcota bacterium]
MVDRETNPSTRPGAARPPSQQYDVAETMRLLAARQRAVNVPALVAAMDAGNPGQVHAEVDRVAASGLLVNASEVLRTLLDLSAVSPAERLWFDPRRLIAFTVKLHEGGDVDATRVAAAQDLQRSLEAWVKALEGRNRAALGRGFTERLQYCGQLARLDASFPAALRDAIGHDIIRGQASGALAAMEQLIAKDPKQAEYAFHQMERDAPRLYRDLAPLAEQAAARAQRAYGRVELLGRPAWVWALIVVGLATLVVLAWPSGDADAPESPGGAPLIAAAATVCEAVGADTDACKWASRAADALRLDRCPLAQETVARMESAVAADTVHLAAADQRAATDAAARLSAALPVRCP